MRNCSPPRLLRWLSPFALALLSGCQGGILDPKGRIAADEKSLIITATLLMLLVVVPVIVLTLVFAWKYRASNANATYTPKWAHSTKLEVVVWLIPIVIVSFLAVLTWRTTHQLDPYRPLSSDKKPVKIEVVALNWKWLFIYPELNIATVNQIAFPKDVPVDFRITSDTVMNSFFIPQLGGQIYAMAGMQTQLHLIADEAGTYKGFSANYSGAGFSGMKFDAVATSTPADFDKWVAQVRANAKPLDVDAYRRLAVPSENHAVAYYVAPTPQLFDAVVHKYMAGRTSLALSDDDIKLAALTKRLCAPAAARSVN
ncbi:ubiquinol oxidase subunit II [Paludibacterium purpuratum]|uniref:Ubiquinol oxidase subunit 2 n=1 Tax=Paludibacterium purpuratum TaxID=1144873 RepID=A0A4R7B696_9NEIS|nr:ubiquinol oxidase subunit II [Paludibacterium purpuratum]TDR78433.1 cytochrome bo3 quinol oxidase subunit 2 [Paludibacterium purpuratum]